MFYYEVSGLLRYYRDGVEQRWDICTRLDAADPESAVQEALDNLIDELQAREDASADEPAEISRIGWVSAPSVRVLTDVCLG
jgi:hypothetical protein